jgi:hypothetical protein
MSTLGTKIGQTLGAVPGVDIAVSGFDPLTLGPRRWWRADTIDNATNFDLLDKTGNGGTQRQASGAPTAMPTIVAPAEIGGKPALRFDGVNDYLAPIDAAANYAFLNRGAGFTVYALIIPRTALVAGESILDSYSSGANPGFRLLFGATATTVRFTMLNNAAGFAIDANATLAFVVGTPVLLTVRFIDDASANEFDLKKNNVSGATGAATLDASPNNPPAALNIARRPNGTAFAEIDFADCFLFDRDLSGAENTQMVAYFTARYGTP